MLVETVAFILASKISGFSQSYPVCHKVVSLAARV